MIDFLLTVMLTVIVILGLWMLWQRGAFSRREDDAQEDARISPLLRGINYLLAEEPDRALQEMVKVARLRSEAAEVYMALGGMFRAKGEIGRAVRIHQNILARPGISPEMYLQASFALAQDFQTGGLLDRALKQYGKVLERESGHVGALEASLRIREQSSEWALADELLLRLDRVRRSESNLHRAYLLAEIAREKKKAGDIAGGLEYAEQALRLSPMCASAYLLKIEIHLVNNERKEALASMEALRDSAPQYLPLLPPLLIKHAKCYKAFGKEFLLRCWEEARGDSFALSWLEAVNDKEKGGEKVVNLASELQFEPIGLRSALRLAAISGVESAFSRHAIEWRKQAKNFLCQRCGVEVVEMRWQCPQCHEWGSMKSISDKEV